MGRDALVWDAILMTGEVSALEISSQLITLKTIDKSK